MWQYLCKDVFFERKVKMKKIPILLMLLLPPMNSWAQRVELDKENLAWAVASLLPSALMHTFLHESSHAIAAKALGAEVTEFHVWDIFSIGQIDTKWDRRPSERQITMFLLAPQATNILLFSVTELLFASEAISPRSRLAPILFIFGEFLPWLDITLVTIGSFDIRMLEQRTSIQPEVTRSVGAAISVVGAVFLAHRAYRVFFKKIRARETVSHVRVSMQGEAGISVALDF